MHTSASRAPTTKASPHARQACSSCHAPHPHHHHHQVPRKDHTNMLPVPHEPARGCVCYGLRGHGQDHQTAVFGAARFMSSLRSVGSSQACGRATSRWAPLSRNTTMLQRHVHRQAAVPRPGPSSAAASWPAAKPLRFSRERRAGSCRGESATPRRAHARMKGRSVVGADGSGAGYAVSSPLVSACKVV